MYYVVKYTGQFGFIKPWTAVRDSETFSQQFLTPSIVEGIEKKLFPELLNETGIKKIVRHRLSYASLELQTEVTWAKKRKIWKEKNIYKSNNAIITRGVMLHPALYIAFENGNDAEVAFSQTVCLARNEDLLFPIESKQMETDEFDNLNGFELIFSNSAEGFKVGHNRFDDSEMFGSLKAFGNPIQTNYE
ncbi:MAG: hypothetical protein WC313_06510 [Candidatus Kapaibacterium sp.]|jgi:hypothetical protein